MTAPAAPPPPVKKKPSLIRWERVRPALIGLAILSLLIYLFLDPVIKWAIIKAGQGVFGARVNIASVKTKLRQGRLSIRGLQVADKSAPMQNLFQWDDAAFDFRSLPLLEKKVFIDEASLNGLKFGAPRKTSGALTWEEKQPGFVGKAVDRMWSQVETISLEKFEDAKKNYDPRTLLTTNRLESLQVADRAKEQIQKAPEEVQKQIAQLNAPQRTEAFKKRAEALGKGGSGPEAVLQKVTEAKTLQTDLQAFRSDIAQTQNSVIGQIRSAQALVEEARKAKEDDWKMLRSKLSLPTLDKASIARALFGPTVTRWAERLLNGVHTARVYMPAKPKSPPPPPRGRSRTIEFPRAHELPRFTLAKAQLSGEVGQERPFGFSGTLTGITTNPQLYGKPATLSLHGSQGPRTFKVDGMLDHTEDTPAESLEAVYNGFSLNSLSFGQPEGVGFGLKQGEGRAHLALSVRGDAISGRAELQGSGLAVEPRINLKSDAAIAQRAVKNISASLANVKAMNVGIGVSGTLASPDLSIDSNIGSVVSDALKGALGAEVAEQEKALRAEFERQTAGKIQELQQQVNDLQQKYLPQLASNNKVVEELMTQVKNQAARSIPGAGGKPLESIKSIFGR